MIHVRKDGVGAVEGGREWGMTGDTEGAFPIPSLPLKGNKECENTRKHLWTHSLCGFWVSPPSSTRCSPAFRAGVWDEPSCRLPGPPFLSWGMVTHVALLALAGCTRVVWC